MSEYTAENDAPEIHAPCGARLDRPAPGWCGLPSSHTAENDAPARHRCEDCGCFVPGATIVAWRDFESGVVEATGTCVRCGVVDVTRVIPPDRSSDEPVTPPFSTHEQGNPHVNAPWEAP
jgi:hypothetical protein